MILKALDLHIKASSEEVQIEGAVLVVAHQPELPGRRLGQRLLAEAELSQVRRIPLREPLIPVVTEP